MCTLCTHVCDEDDMRAMELRMCCVRIEKKNILQPEQFIFVYMCANVNICARNYILRLMNYVILFKCVKIYFVQSPKFEKCKQS